MIFGGAITLVGVYIVIRRERKIFDTGYVTLPQGQWL